MVATEWMKGRLCLVTGATGGIGLETARWLADLGAKVVVVARDPKRGERAVEDLRARGGEAELLLADLSLMKEVRRLAGEFRERFAALHVLVNNAGAIFSERAVTEEGFERTFALNHLSPFLLTNLLVDLLKASAPSRIVTVSSGAHLIGHIDFDDLQCERRYTPMRAYAQSKLANILFTRELSRRLAGTAVTANAVHPGAVASGFGRSGSGGWALFFKLGAPFLSSAEKGARTSIYLASSPEVDTVSGGYFARCRPTRTSRESQDPEVARRLWDASARLVSLGAEEGRGAPP